MQKLNVKKRIEDLYVIKAEMAPETRVEKLFEKLNSKKFGDNPIDILDATIWGIHLLSEYQKNYAVNRRVADTLVRSTKERIDFLNKIASSEMADLQATFYLILSKIESMHGNHWNAMNFKNYSFDLNKKNIPGGIANAYFAYGHSYLRKGFGLAAIENFRLASENAEGYQLESALLLLAKTYRLCNQFNKASEALARLEALGKPTAKITTEVSWERLAAEAQQSGNIRPLIETVSKHENHRSPSYVLEAKLWSFCVKASRFIPTLPKVSSLARDKQLGIAQAGSLYKNVAALEEGFDDIRPLSHRMEKLSSALERTSELKLVEHSQLFFLAACHWFHQNKLYSSALNCLVQYEQISLSLTDGSNKDHLNLSSNLQKKPWYCTNVTIKTSQIA